MKNFYFTLTLVMGVQLTSYSQNQPDTLKTWDTSGKAGLLFNQVSLTNWSAGGNNSLALGATLDLSANYKKDKLAWANSMTLGYGISKQGDDPLNKTDDRIIYNTNLSYDLSGPWSVAVNINFRTQFANGFNQPNDSVRISAFMSPGYLVAGLGIKYEPNKSFFVEIDPVTNKTLFVLDNALAAQGAFGVDSTKNIRAEFGGFFIAKFSKEIMKNITLNTNLTLFSNYKDNPQNIDVNWDLTFDFKINEVFSAQFVTQMIYDDDVRFPVDTNGDGINDSDEARLQFRQALGLGLVAKF